MSVNDLKAGNFDTVVGQDGIVLISCWSPGCGACRAAKPLFERMAERRSEHVFARLNTFEERDLSARLDIRHVPALVAYRDGIHLVTLPGSFDEERLEFLLSKASALDMEKVRAELAEGGQEESPGRLEEKV